MVMESFLLNWTWAFIFIILLGKSIAACSTDNQVNKKDPDIVVNNNETQCMITLQSPDERQVVAEFFGMFPDCIDKSRIKIYDGPVGSETLIHIFCQRDPISYISRKQRLRIVYKSDNKAPKPFSLNVYLIGTRQIYSASEGSIKSVQFMGSCDAKNCTPNNFHGIYDIRSDENVTFHLHFVKVRINTETGGHCNGHFLTYTANGQTSEKICGDGNMLNDIYIVTKRLRMEFFTGKINAYSGFTAEFQVCKIEAVGNESLSTFKIPLFDRTPSKSVTCAYIVRVRERSLVKLNINIGRNSMNSCLNEFRVIPDGKPAENDTLIDKCEQRYYELEAFYSISILFIASFGSSLTGNYSVVKLDADAITYSPLGESTIDHVQGNIFSNLSAEAPVMNIEKEKTKGGGFHIIVVAVVLGSLGFIIVLVIVLVLLYRRRRKFVQGNKEKEKENGNDLDIYTDNQDYDVMNMKRLHKSPTETNVYGSTSGPSDVYASADRSENDQDSKNVAEYDLQMFGNTYAETTPISHKTEEKGDLQADEYGHLELGETYEETLTSKQRKAQKYNDNDVNISDEYGHQDFGQYASTTPMTTKRNVETENVYE